MCPLILLINDHLDRDANLLRAMKESQDLNDLGDLCIVTNRDDAERTIRDAQSIEYAVVDYYIPEYPASTESKECGHDLVRAIQERHPRARVLAISNAKEARVLCRMYRAGANSFWHKEDDHSIASAIRMSVRGTHFSSEHVAEDEGKWRRLDLRSIRKADARRRCRAIIEYAADPEAQWKHLPDMLQIGQAQVSNDTHFIYRSLGIAGAGAWPSLRAWARDTAGLPDKTGLPEWFGVEGVRPHQPA